MTMPAIFLAAVLALCACAAVASLAESLHARRFMEALAPAAGLAVVTVLALALASAAPLWAPTAGQVAA